MYGLHLILCLSKLNISQTEANPADPIPCYPGQERDSNGKCQDCKVGDLVVFFESMDALFS